MPQELTSRQQKILDCIHDYIQRNGYPPSVREVAKKMKIKSPRGVAKHLIALERKGHIERSGGMRGIKLANVSIGRETPIIGRIAAGSPILAEENIEGYILLDPSLAPPKRSLVLRIQGESMSGKEIHDGDIAIIKLQPSAENGDIVAARIGDEATIKIFRKRYNEIILEPANPAFKPLKIRAEDDFSIIGTLVKTIKSFN